MDLRKMLFAVVAVVAFRSILKLRKTNSSAGEGPRAPNQDAHGRSIVYRSATGIEIEPSEIKVKSLDEELLSHVISRIESNMQDQCYSVLKLSRDVGMTRGHLYKKLMAIAGTSPVEFIRIVKMKRGKSLLDQGRTNISEVAAMVGYSPKLFARYFKWMFGVTPTDYLKRGSKEVVR